METKTPARQKKGQCANSKAKSHNYCTSPHEACYNTSFMSPHYASPYQHTYSTHMQVLLSKPSVVHSNLKVKA